MKSILISLLTMGLLGSCSLYKSDGRKQFEADAPGKVKAAAFSMKGCQKESTLESWLNGEFPAASYELVISENDLEIWQTTHAGTVEVKALQKTDTATQACYYEFANKSIWESYKDQFIRELENNLMTQD